MNEEENEKSKGRKILYAILSIVFFGMAIYCLYKALDSFGII